MKSNILFILGILTGIVAMVGLQFAGFTIYPSSMSVQSVSGPVGGGFYRGPVPDFSVRPISGDVYEYIDPQWTMISTNKQNVDFQSFKGKVLFVNLWATWCAPCIAEMPDISALREIVSPDDVAFLLITGDQEDLVDAFNNKHNLPLYISQGRFPAVLSGKGLPSTLIIDKKGVIRYKHSGPAEWSHPNVQAFIEELVAEGGEG